MEDFKQCYRCGLWQSLDNFTEYPTGEFEVYHICNDCLDCFLKNFKVVPDEVK